MADGFMLRLDPAAIDGLTDTAEAQVLTQLAGDRVAEKARQLASKDDGDGANSIHAEVSRTATGWVADVSYDQAHFYMGFVELGTLHRTPRPFLRPALTDVQL